MRIDLRVLCAQERPPDKDKVQPHLLLRAITDMMAQIEELGQVKLQVHSHHRLALLRYKKI